MSATRTVVLAWRNLHLVDTAVRGLLDKRLLAEAGCSLLEHDLLAWLAATPQRRLQMLDLADMLGVTRGGLTRIVDRLEERSWVERDRPASNRREVYAVLTAEGERAVVGARTVYSRVLRETLGTHLSSEELDELDRIAGKLRTALTGKGAQR
ncbi:MarR family transcriptional regulator [Nocardia sp. NPDC051463]|uniref:MarR family winged helix-turn-helix transcriptional regulator n=1 Tax=Nocardia sp. NPDC051463 TaxID=3154845 RepID=UPI00345103F1